MGAMDFTDRLWPAAAMEAFGAALVELKLARRDFRRLAARSSHSCMPSEMVHVQGVAQDLATRKVHLDNYAHRLMEVREEYRHIWGADSDDFPQN